MSMFSARLQTVSGRSHTVSLPLPYAELLRVATEDFGYAEDSVKVRLAGGVARVLPLAQAGASLSASDVPAPAAPGAPSSAGTADLSPAATGESRRYAGGGASGSAMQSLPIVVFGLPASVRRAAASSARQPSPQRAAGAGGGGAAAAKPLTYPHSPVGLAELAALAAAYDAGGTGGPAVAMLDHPTMQQVRRLVADGGRDALRAVLEQIKADAPALFAWVLREPARFLALACGPDATEQERRQELVARWTQAMSSGMQPGERRSFVVVVGDSAGTPVRLQVVLDASGDPGEEGGAGASASDDEEEGADGSEELSAGGDSGDVLDEADEADYELMEELAEHEQAYLAMLLQAAAGAELEQQQQQQQQLREPAAESGSGGNAGPAVASPASTGTKSAPLPAPAQPVPPAAASESSPSHHAPASPALNNVTSASNTSTSGGNSKENSAVAARGGVAARAPASSGAPQQGQQQAPATHTRGAAAHALPGTVLAAPSAAELAALQTEMRDCDLTQPPHALHERVQRTVAAYLARLEAFLAADGGPEDTLAAEAAQACDFFSTAEELYLRLLEAGAKTQQPAMLLGPDPGRPLPLLACAMALSRQLTMQAARHLLEPSPETPPSSRPRAGALRNLPGSGSAYWTAWAAWVRPEGPLALVEAVLESGRRQRGAVALWYTSHYYKKPEGKTVQTVAYVLDSRAARVSAARLAFNSKVHKTDEVRGCLERLTAAMARSAVSEELRSEWRMLARKQYRQLVKPIEALLPAAHMSADTLYVVDTRHEPGLAVGAGARPTDTSVWWLPAYTDELSTSCADKWCLALSTALWRLPSAGAAGEALPPAVTDPEDVRATALLVLPPPATDADGNALPPVRPQWLSGAVQERVRFGAPSAGIAGRATHVALVHELPGAAPPAGLTADLRVVQADADRFGRCAGAPDPAAQAPPSGATLQQIWNFPASDVFTGALYLKLAQFPRIPVAAAAREAAMRVARTFNAPWMLVAYALLDYGGPLPALALRLQPPPAADAPETASAAVSERTAAREAAAPAQEEASYAERHHIDDLYEGMLARVLERRPETTEDMLDAMIQHLRQLPHS